MTGEHSDTVSRGRSFLKRKYECYLYLYTACAWLPGGLKKELDPLELQSQMAVSYDADGTPWVLCPEHATKDDYHHFPPPPLCFSSPHFLLRVQPHSLAILELTEFTKMILSLRSSLPCVPTAGSHACVTASHLTKPPVVFLDWLSSRCQGSYCVHTPSTEITRAHFFPWPSSMWVAGIRRLWSLQCAVSTSPMEPLTQPPHYLQRYLDDFVFTLYSARSIKDGDYRTSSLNFIEEKFCVEYRMGCCTNYWMSVEIVLHFFLSEIIFNGWLAFLIFKQTTIQFKNKVEDVVLPL